MYLFVIAVVSISTSYVEASPAVRIAGGHETTIDKHGYQASLEISGLHTCGGVIISNRYVLTAAHCLTRNNQVNNLAEQLFIRVCSSFRQRDGRLYKADWFVIHEEFEEDRSSGMTKNDLALVRSESMMQLDNQCNSISMHCGNVSKTGVYGVVTGWGSNGIYSSDQLHEVSLPVIEMDYCEEFYYKFGRLPEGQFCAFEFGRNICAGDEGGAFVVDGELVGIVAWTIGCSSYVLPGVFTDVSRYYDWVQQYLTLV